MKVYFLGTGASSNASGRETTMLAVATLSEVIVIDCGGNVGRALTAAGIALKDVSHLILTHGHPDHTSGFPLLVQQLWLAGRRQPFSVYAPLPALELVQRLLAQYDTAAWDGLFEIIYHCVPLEPGVQIFQTTHVAATTTPVCHSEPTIGIRFAHRSGSAFVYSSDTAPTSELVTLARGAEVLIHEADGSCASHSSGTDAGRIAQEAGVAQLILVHLTGDLREIEATTHAAQAQFKGQVFPGHDGLCIDLAR